MVAWPRKLILTERKERNLGLVDLNDLDLKDFESFSFSKYSYFDCSRSKSKNTDNKIIYY